MRHAYSAARVAFWLLIAAVMATSSFAQQLSITNYVITTSTRVSLDVWQYTYSATLLNQGPALTSAIATLSVSVPNITLVAGENVLHFGPVAANGQVAAKNTFTINVNRTVAFQLTDLQWAFVTNGGTAPPVANPGPNQTAPVGSTVTLNGSGSTNPSGIGTLSYSWVFTGLPPASNTSLVNPNSVMPTFLMDVPGTYVIQLTVSNGTASSSATVTVSTAVAPVANAGPNQSVAVGALVTLNGSQSSDSNGALLTYSWQFTSMPTGSSAVLNGASTVNPTFIADKPGAFVVQLIVNDGVQNSAPASVTISQDSAPVAVAGQNQSNVPVGSVVQLNGSQSTDVDGNSLTYLWSLITLPAGSNAVLSNTTLVDPTFTADVANGTYVAQLTVNDGTFNSSPSTVTITTGTIIQAPTANPGLPQLLAPGATVTLDGSASSDPQNLTLTYTWSFTTKPVSSNAVLSSTSAIKPTFVGDVLGTYVIQLVVNNGSFSSAPATVTIAIDTPPVANPGSNQSVAVGANVLLSGSGSFDADNDALTYSWSFTSRPNGSTATLSGANSVAPTFTPDVAGTYVVQLIVNDTITSSNPPATVTINAIAAKTITLTPNPLNVSTTTGSDTLTVTLASPAGPNGQVVTLASSSPSYVSLPASVTIPANATSATVNVVPHVVGTATITGSASGFTSGTATVNVVVPTLTITLGEPNVGVGGQITGLATLNIPAPSTTTIGLNAVPSGVVTVPSTVPIAAGATTASFTIAGVSVNTTTLRGVLPGYSSVAALVTVIKEPLINLPASLTAQAGQAPVTLNISLQNPAPTGGVTVNLTSSNPANATVTASVFIAAGATTPATQPTVTGLVPGTTSIGASATGYASGSTNVTVTAGPPASIATGGTPQSVFVSTAFAPLTATVKDSLGNPVSGASVAFTAPAAAGAPGVTVATTTATTNSSGVATASLTANATVGGPYTVTASVNGVTASYSLTNLTAPPKVITLTPNPLTVSTTTGSDTLTVTLASPAGPSGQVVTLASSSPSYVSLPASVTIPANATSATVNVVPHVVGTSTITGSASGFTSGTATVNVVSATATITLSYPSVGVGGQITGTATLNVPAISATSIALSSNPTGVVTVPSSVAIAAGGTTGSFTVTGVAVNTTTVRGVIPGYGSVGASVTVVKAPLIGLPASLTAQAGQAPVALNVTLQSPAPTGGVTVTLTSSNPVSGTVTPSVSIAAGATSPTTQPTVTGLAPGTTTISASATGYASASTTVTVTAGPPSSITTGGTPQSMAINTPFAALTAAVKDSLGNPVSGASVTFTAPATAGAPGVTVATTTVTTNSSGVATANLTSNATVGGPYTVTASVNGVTAGYSLTNLSGPPKTIALAATNSGSGQSAQILTAFTNPLKAIVKDAGGNPIAGVLVKFSAPTTAGAASGTFAGASTATATTDATGTATSPQFTANGTVSPSGTPYTVTVSVNSNTALTASFSLTNLAGPPTQIAATAGSGQSIAISTAFGTLLQATVKDAGGNVASGVSVIFTAPSGSGATGTFAGGVSTVTIPTNTSGVAIAPAFTANTVAGAFTVTATFTGGPTASFSLTNNAGAASSITASSAAQSVPINTAFATLQATVKDAGGNLVNGATVTFTAVPASNGASGKFATTPATATTVNGVASAPTFTANLIEGSFTVTAAVAGVSPSASFSLTNLQGNPNTVTGTPGTPTVQAGLGPVTLPQVTVKDAGGNLLTNQTVTFTVVPGSNGQGGTFAGNLASATALTNSAGTATMPAFTANFTLGAYTVTASINGLSTSFTLTNVAGVPATITPSPTSASAAINAAYVPLNATVKDAGGNPVGAGITVTFTAPATAGSPGVTVGTTTANTNASGVATTSTVFIANATKGAFTVTATSGTATPATFSLSNTPGPPSLIAATAGNNQSVQNTTQFPTALTVTVTDAGGDLLSGVPATFTIVAGSGGQSGTFTGGTTATTAIVNTNASGVATAPFITANGKLGAFTVTVTVPLTSGTLSMTTPFTLTNLSGPPATATANTGTSGQSAAVNANFATLLSATLKDAGGNLAVGYSVTFTAVPNAGGASGTFAGLGTVAHATSVTGGVVTAPAAFTANTTAGTYTVTMTVDTAPSVSATFTLTNNAGAAATITATGGTPQNVVVNSVLGTALSATVKDSFGNPVSGASVIFTAPGTGASGKFGSSATTSVTTNASGVATTVTPFTANTVIGADNVVATSGAATSATFALTNTAGPAATIVPAASSTPQSVNAGQPFAALAAVVKDSFGNLVIGQPVVFTAPSGSVPSGLFTGNVTTITVNTDATGTATAPFTANSFASTTAYNVTATINGLTATFVLTNKPGGAAKIVANTGTTPQSQQITMAFTNALAVTVTDGNSNPVSGQGVTFTAVPASNGASGTFAGTGNPPSVTVTTLANGVATAPAFTPNLILGSYTVTASTVNSLSTSFALTNIAGPPKTMTVTSGSGQIAQISTKFTNPLVVTVTDVAGNPATGSVTFTAPSSGASVTFAGSATVPIVAGVATSPAITANGITNAASMVNGVLTYATYNVTASATGVSATFALSNTPGPAAKIVANAGTTPQSASAGEPFATALGVTVTDASGNLIPGASVTFTAPTGGGPSGYFGAPQTMTVTTNTSGIVTVPFLANLTAGGPYSVTATVQTTVANVAPATFSMTNTPCVSCASISVANPLGGSLSIGQNLQTGATVTLSAPAGTNGTTVTLTSSDPTALLVSGHIGQTGTASITVPFTSGSSQVGIYLQGVSNTGSAYLIASAPGYQFGVATVTLTPSGFVMVVNNALGGNLVTNNGDQSTITLLAYQLDSSNNPLGPQSLAGGFTANVPIQTSNGSVGTITPASPVAYTGPSDTTNGVPITFNADPANTGTTTLTVSAPAGFNTPITGNTLIVTVNSSQLTMTQADATIGQNLQTSGQVLISGAAGPNGVPATVTSTNPSQLLVSTSPTAAGTGSIALNIGSGFSKTPTFYLQNISASSGTVAITIAASGYQTLTRNVTLAPSGVIVYGPFGIGVPSFNTTTLSATSTITVVTEVLGSGNVPVGPQSVAGGLTVTSTITSSPTSVGTITNSPVSIAGGSGSTTTQFQPNASSSTGGTATISASVPPGFSTPGADQTVQAIVTEPGMSLSASGSSIGQNLQVQDAVILGAPAPAAGLQVTITSNNPSLLMLSATATGTGTASITITIPAGGTSGSYYLQSFGNSGTVSYFAAAPGFNNRNGSITLANSGLVLAGPLGLGAPGANESVTAGPDSTWTIYTAQLDGSNNYVVAQSLRAGMTVTANLTSTNTTAGTIASPVTITGGGASSVTTTFTPKAVGSTTVVLAQPSNLGLATNNEGGGFYASIPVNVKP
jgi:hypothetical protein